MTAQIWPPDTISIAHAADLLRQGQVVGMPTETVYGLAADAFQPEAVLKIFQTKERPAFDPLIVHVPFHLKPDLAWLDSLGLVDANAVPLEARPALERLLQQTWPGPLTVVLPRQSKVPDLVTSGLATVAVRMPAHPVAQALLQAVDTPLAAPSANRFGRISPTTAAAVFEELGDRIPGILDGGPCQVGIESTIVGLNAQGGWQLLRPGEWTPTQLEDILQAPVRIQLSTHSNPQAPGMLDQHYAPGKNLYLLPQPLTEMLQLPKPAFDLIPTSVGLLLMKSYPDDLLKAVSDWCGCSLQVECLSPQGDPVEIAQHLFQGLRALDQSTATVLWSESCVHSEGLLWAVADRLRRASHGFLPLENISDGV